jgi:hypothetical protein
MRMVMDRNDALRTYYGAQLEVFLDAIDQLLAGPGAYFDPETLPDPSRPATFCARYYHLRRSVAELVPGPLPTRAYEITRGEGFPIAGCLLRKDMESMREDVEACLVALCPTERTA